ncbi:hypothetical protein ACOMHN_050779 [Nucella lapillus]
MKRGTLFSFAFTSSAKKPCGDARSFQESEARTSSSEVGTDDEALAICSKENDASACGMETATDMEMEEAAHQRGTSESLTEPQKKTFQKAWVKKWPWLQTRGHREKMMQTQPSVDAYKYSFFPASIVLWNALPTPSLTAQSVPSFRSSLRGWAPPSL